MSRSGSPPSWGARAGATASQDPLAATAEQLLGPSLERVVRVDQPLVLISQAQRSGGTLLLRLLDGHPQCDVVPFQLRAIEKAGKMTIRDPDELWRILHDPKLAERFRSGHRQQKHKVLQDPEVFPFVLPPRLQRDVYDRLAKELERPTKRQLFDCYFTAYFTAWLDYANRGATEKRWLIGFEPAVAIHKRGWLGLLDAYPDGRVISIVRDPWSWYASARRWEPRWRDRDRALDHWCHVASRTLRWRKKAKGLLYLLPFEDLLARTPETTGALARWLEIEDSVELRRPTFNGRPIRANTSFGDVSAEISTRPLERARQELDGRDAAYVERRAGELYEQLTARIEKDRQARAVT